MLCKPQLVQESCVSRNAVPRKPCHDHWTWREPKRTLSSNSRQAEVDTDDASRAQSNLHTSTTNPSTTHSSTGCAVTHVCRVDRHLSVWTHSTLTRTSSVTSYKQLHAQAALEDSSFCETSAVHCSLFHHSERKDAVLEHGETAPRSSSRTRAGTVCSATSGIGGTEREKSRMETQQSPKPSTKTCWSHPSL